MTDEVAEAARGHHLAHWFTSANTYGQARRPPDIEEWRRTDRSANERSRAYGAESARTNQRITALEAEVSQLRSLKLEVAKLRSEVESFRSLLGLSDEDDTTEVHPGLRWLEAHSEVLQQYRGKEIAIDPVDGVVAVADSLSQLHQELQQKGLLGKVFIESVPEM